MGNIKQRAGQIRVRLGGNTQEFAGYVEELENHRAISKASDVNPRNPVCTPILLYRDSFYYSRMINDDECVDLDSGCHLYPRFVLSRWEYFGLR